MQSTAKNAQLAAPVEVPDGEYDGIWSGYTVKFQVNYILMQAQTDDGIRSKAAQCKVIARDGILTVETFK